MVAVPVSARSPALDAALDRVGDRWSLLVVDALLDGPLRFGEVRKAVPGIATSVLSQRLRHLEAAQVVVAQAYTRRPPRFSYHLTASGRELAGALRLLTRWGTDVSVASGGGGTEGPEHGLCGTALDVTWWCPTCEQPVGGTGEDPPVYV
ncbi:MAG TPA: helix-turn-helix domain-containing protein [Acidimicrobiales bacterium]|nr:helix-turn-helix domain-containing protein [Acidimicrobiales bacterium]